MNYERRITEMRREELNGIDIVLVIQAHTIAIVLVIQAHTQ